MAKKQIKVIILQDKESKEVSYFQDLTSVERFGLFHNDEIISADYMRKFMKLNGLFENDKYTVRKGFIDIIKIKNKR